MDYVFLHSSPIKEITPPIVLEVIRAVESRGALDVASRILQRTSAVFRYAIQTGRATYNPAADMKGVLKTRKVEHRAAISRDELPEFLKKLDSYSGDPVCCIETDRDRNRTTITLRKNTEDNT